MTRVHFGDEDRTMSDGEPIPPGQYLMRCTENGKKILPDGRELWEVTLQVSEGDHEGRNVWDNIFFTKKALQRAFLCLSSFLADQDDPALTPEARQAAIDAALDSLDTDQTDLILGKRALVTVAHRKFTGNDGDERTKAEPTFRGYAAFDSAAAPAAHPGGATGQAVDYGDIPF